MQMADMKVKDDEFKLKMQALGFTHVEEMAKFGLEETKAYIGDVQGSREKFAANQGVFKLGIVILLVFSASVGLSMWGAYLLLSGGITIKDIGIVAAVFSFLGTIVGYMAANAQQVVGYFFGSSKGSGDNREALAASVTHLDQALGRK